MMIWPYYVSQGSSKGDLLIAFVFVHFFPPFFHPYGSRRGNGALWFSDVCLTVYQSEDGEGKAQRVLSHKPVSAEAGLGCWTRANASTKNSVTSPSFMVGI